MTRPKSVSFVAVSFILLAVTFGYCSGCRFLYFIPHHNAYHLLWGIPLLILAIFFAAAAVGLWRLIPSARVPAIVLASVLTVFSLGKFFFSGTMLSDLKGLEMPESIGYVIGAVGLLFWLASPIYILTRPATSNAFKRPDVA